MAAIYLCESKRLAIPLLSNICFRRSNCKEAPLLSDAEPLMAKKAETQMQNIRSFSFIDIPVIKNGSLKMCLSLYAGIRACVLLCRYTCGMEIRAR